MGPTGPRAMEEWQGDPVGWIERFLGVPRHTLVWSLNPGYEAHKWDGTADPMQLIADSLVAKRHVCVESATGTGKSFFAACLLLWFLACHERAKVATYAPTEKQLRLFMWAEVTELWPRFQRLFPMAVKTDLRIRMDGRGDKWGAQGVATQIKAGEKSATSIQGAHAQYFLAITEETPGMAPSALTAIRNTLTDTHNLHLALGNPDHQHDPLHRLLKMSRYQHVRISAYDHPNLVTNSPVIPGSLSWQTVNDRADDPMGGGRGSQLFESRVRGICPSESQNALIRYAWIERAVARWNDSHERRRLEARGGGALGVDAAHSIGGDKAAIARGKGAALLQIDSFQNPNGFDLAFRVASEMVLHSIDERNVGLDAVGVGASPIDKLHELGYNPVAYNAGTPAVPGIDEDLVADDKRAVAEAGRYRNLRAQSWWQARVDFERDRIAIPYDEDLINDLLTPQWWTHNGKVVLEPKEDIVERLGRSPDKGDAFVMWNWVRPRLPDPKPDEERSAWHEEVLAAEAAESRRVHDAPPRKRSDLDPTLVERMK